MRHQLDDQKVQFYDELSDVLVLPDGLVEISWGLADLLNVGRVGSFAKRNEILKRLTDQLLKVFLNCEGPSEFADVFLAPSPHVADFGARSVSAHRCGIIHFI